MNIYIYIFSLVTASFLLSFFFSFLKFWIFFFFLNLLKIKIKKDRIGSCYTGRAKRTVGWNRRSLGLTWRRCAREARGSDGRKFYRRVEALKQSDRLDFCAHEQISLRSI